MLHEKYHKKDRYAIRKFKVGVGSILLGSLFLVVPSLTDTSIAQADEITPSEKADVQAKEVVDSSPNTELSTLEKTENLANVEEKVTEAVDSSPVEKLESPNADTNSEPLSAAKDTEAAEHKNPTAVTEEEKKVEEKPATRTAAVNYKVTYTDVATNEVVLSQNHTTAETTELPKDQPATINVNVDARVALKSQPALAGYKLAANQPEIQAAEVVERGGRKNIVNINVSKEHQITARSNDESRTGFRTVPANGSTPNDYAEPSASTLRDDYAVSFKDMGALTGRPQDPGLVKLSDYVYVYKYAFNDKTPFNIDDFRKRLVLTPKDPANPKKLRTLEGTEVFDKTKYTSSNNILKSPEGDKDIDLAKVIYGSQGEISSLTPVGTATDGNGGEKSFTTIGTGFENSSVWKTNNDGNTVNTGPGTPTDFRYVNGASYTLQVHKSIFDKTNAAGDPVLAVDIKNDKYRQQRAIVFIQGVDIDKPVINADQTRTNFNNSDKDNQGKDWTSVQTEDAFVGNLEARLNDLTKNPANVVATDNVHRTDDLSKDSTILGENRTRYKFRDAEGKLLTKEELLAKAKSEPMEAVKYTMVAIVTDDSGNVSDPVELRTFSITNDTAKNNPTTEVITVANTNNLSDSEKQAVKDKIKQLNKNLTSSGKPLTLTDDMITVSADGTAVITYPDGTTDTFTPAQTVKQIKINNPEPTLIKDPTNLTDKEKEAVKEAVKKSNPDVDPNTIKVEKDGTVTFTKDGKEFKVPQAETTAVKPSPTLVKDPNNLTDKEKEAVKEAVKKSNPDVDPNTIKVEKDGSVTFTKDGKAFKVPQAETTAVKPSPTLVKDPNNLTDKEKEAVKEAVKKSNPDVDPNTIKVGKDGTVTFTKDGKEFKVPQAETTAVKPEPTLVKDPNNLTDKEKEAVKEAVKKVNPDVDPNTIKVEKDGSATFTKDGKEFKVPQAETTAVKPSPTLVKDPNNLTDKEKEAVKEAVKKSNPGVDPNTIKVEKDGTVTFTKDGKKFTVPQAETTAVKPSPTLVKDPNNLTDKEKEAVKEAVKKVNPDVDPNTIKVEKDGSVTFTKDGKEFKVPQAETTAVKPSPTLVKDPNNLTDKEKEAVKKSNPDVDPNTIKVGKDGTVTFTKDGKEFKVPQAETTVVKPAPTLVKDPNNLTDKEKEAVKEAVKKVNPDVDPNTIKVEKDGSVTFTKDGKKFTVPQAETTAVKPSPTLVKDPNNLTDKEKEAIKEAVKKSNPDVDPNTIKVEKDGTVTFTKDGKEFKVPQAETTAVKPEPTLVKDPANLTDEEKEAIKEAVKKSNPDVDPNTIKVGNDGTVTFTKDGKELTVPQAETTAVKPSPTLVKDPANLTDKEKEAIKEAVKKSNPDVDPNTIKVEKDGTVTFTKDGKEFTVPQAVMTVVKPSLTWVKDPQNLTSAEKEEVKKKVKEKNPDLPEKTEITVGKDGTVTIKVPGQATSVEVTDTVASVKVPDKTVVKDPQNLTPEEREEIKKRVKESNPELPEKTEIIVGKDGTVTIKVPGQDASIELANTVVSVKVPGKIVDKDPQNLTPEQPKQPGMVQPSDTMKDKKVKGMKQADKATKKDLPETGNTNNPFVAAFGFLTLLVGARMTRRKRREEN
ncbi:YSIRK-type signal peptide-containing protein [Staphylococcus americanisciuri]|uniref:YSIRK-type signal peptide-containing protein n=1 Tax=Staphylococcus americanisciuri TaxID=2973940 RepID=A0ABT2F3A3_9STAP|nr:YSIRK-type signal peptide-containing protein [Staphylococcus americanisciuri]MCS4486884.1 YSIRK-type signal peptide-containing protein [Staphylococcus americanisciuri]